MCMILLECWTRELLGLKGVINYQLCWQIICPCDPSAEKRSYEFGENCGRGERRCDYGWWKCGRNTRHGKLEGRHEYGDFWTRLKLCIQQLRGLCIQSFSSIFLLDPHCLVLWADWVTWALFLSDKFNCFVALKGAVWGDLGGKLTLRDFCASFLRRMSHLQVSVLWAAYCCRSSWFADLTLCASALQLCPLCRLVASVAPFAVFLLLISFDFRDGVWDNNVALWLPWMAVTQLSIPVSIRRILSYSGWRERENLARYKQGFLRADHFHSSQEPVLWGTVEI